MKNHKTNLKCEWSASGQRRKIKYDFNVQSAFTQVQIPTFAPCHFPFVFCNLRMAESYCGARSYFQVAAAFCHPTYLSPSPSENASSDCKFYFISIFLFPVSLSPLPHTLPYPLLRSKIPRTLRGGAWFTTSVTLHLHSYIPIHMSSFHVRLFPPTHSHLCMKERGAFLLPKAPEVCTAPCANIRQAELQVL